VIGWQVAIRIRAASPACRRRLRPSPARPHRGVETLETATVKVIAGFTALGSALNNTIKTIGGALSTPARKR